MIGGARGFGHSNALPKTSLATSLPLRITTFAHTDGKNARGGRHLFGLVARIKQWLAARFRPTNAIRGTQEDQGRDLIEPRLADTG